MATVLHVWAPSQLLIVATRRYLLAISMESFCFCTTTFITKEIHQKTKHPLKTKILIIEREERKTQAIPTLYYYSLEQQLSLASQLASQRVALVVVESSSNSSSLLQSRHRKRERVLLLFIALREQLNRYLLVSAIKNNTCDRVRHGSNSTQHSTTTLSDLMSRIYSTSQLVESVELYNSSGYVPQAQTPF